MIIKADGMFFLIIVIASLLVGPRARHFTRPPDDLLVCLFTNLV